MLKHNRWMRPLTLTVTMLLLFAALGTACGAGPTPQVIEKEVVVEKPVVETVVVEKEVPIEKEVVKTVVVLKVVTPTPKPTLLNLSMWSSPKYLNPILQGDGYSQTTWAFMHAGLVRFNENLEPSPWLAKEWTVSDDGLTYTFVIDEKAKWHDGQPVTAQDVALTFRLIADAKTGAFNYSRFTSIDGWAAFHDGEATDIAGLEVVDDHTIKVTLSKPSAPFLANVAQYFRVLPAHILEGVPGDEIATHPYTTNPVGAGPFKFVQYVTDQFVEFEAFDDYVLGRPKVDRIILRIGTQDVLLAQLERGEIDEAPVPPLEVERTKKLPNVVVYTWPTDVWQTIHINLTKPYFQDKRVRQAIVYALPRENMIKTLYQGQATLVNGPTVSPKWAINPDLNTYPYDPAKAKELLQAAGWDSSRKLVMRVPTGNKPREQSAPIIQQALKEVGIETEIQMADFPTFAGDLRSGNYDLALVGFWSGTDPDIPFTNFHSEMVDPKGWNFTHYSNPRVDELYEKGRTLVDMEERRAVYFEVQKIINDELPMVFLYAENAIEAVNKRVKGVKPVTALNFYWNIHEWRIEE